jgi:glycerol-1-phosphate dehydrogenase [NAD(P)+]
MSVPADILDVTDLSALQRVIDEDDPERALAPIGLSRIDMGPAAIAGLPGIVSGLARGGRVAVLMDATPMRRNGDDLKALVGAMLADSAVTEHRLGEAGHLLAADDDAIARARAAYEGAGCVVAVGSGTITDIAKQAVSHPDGPPLVVVQTAASVNAFSDDMAVVLQSGVKRTVPSRWPDALLIDLEVLAAAPPAMNLAGYGDLLAAWTAPADWRLAALAGMDDTYHPAPVRLLRGPAERLLHDAPLVAAGTAAGLESLAGALTLSGIALGIARTTAPLSGTEHLISHLLDMRLELAHRPLALHGAQVGLASVLAAALWSQVLEDFDAASLAAAAPPSDEHVAADVHRAFGPADPSGAITTECTRDCLAKLARWREGRTALAASWDAHRAELADALLPAEELADALRAAGAVSSFGELDPPLGIEDVRWALERLPLMRNRFTVADLLYYGGRWNGDCVELILERARELGVVA